MLQGRTWGYRGGLEVNCFNEIQPDLVCELHVLTWMAYATAQLFGPLPPGALGEGPKGQISINLNFKDF